MLAVVDYYMLENLINAQPIVLKSIPLHSALNLWCTREGDFCDKILPLDTTTAAHAGGSCEK